MGRSSSGDGIGARQLRSESEEATQTKRTGGLEIAAARSVARNSDRKGPTNRASHTGSSMTESRCVFNRFSMGGWDGGASGIRMGPMEALELRIPAERIALEGFLGLVGC